MTYRDHVVFIRTCVACMAIFITTKLATGTPGFKALLGILIAIAMGALWVLLERKAAQVAEGQKWWDHMSEVIADLEDRASESGGARDTPSLIGSGLESIKNELEKRRPPGRPKGAGGWAARDAPLVEKMRKIIEENPGMTAHGAAAHIVEAAAGNASFERKQRRLADRYRQTYPASE